MHGHRRWSRSLLGAVVALAALAVLPLGTAAPAVAQSAADVVQSCEPATDVPETGPRACGGLERGTWLAAQHCRRVPSAEEPVCPALDGRPVHEAAVQGYEQSWVAHALDLQRDLDLDVPLTASLILHTHNSGNSAAYDPSLTINDANQVLSVTDQLRLGIRGIELDLHWTPNPAGEPEDGLRAVVQCHGQTVATPAGSVHPGCSVDRTFDDHVAELAAWLGRPEAEDELVLLYLENQLDGDEAAHASAVASLERHLGALLHRPAHGAGCQHLPVHRTKRELMADGARVLLTGNCGPGGWTDLVFERGGAWEESGSSTDDLVGSDCDAEREAVGYDEAFVRRYEDSTFLSLMVNGGSHISPEAAAAMVRCGVNLPGLDQVHPGDERLPALVWSWRADADLDDPAAACAVQAVDGRFDAAPCVTVRPVACRTSEGGWAASGRSVAWAFADLACRAGGHDGAGVPANGWDNELLRRATEGVGDVWLAYARQRQPDGTERWTVGVPRPAADSPGPDRAPDPPRRRLVEPAPGDGPQRASRLSADHDVIAVDASRTAYGDDPGSVPVRSRIGLAALLAAGLVAAGAGRRALRR